MGSMKKTFFYHDKAVFGLDIGFSNLKVMQLQAGKNFYRVLGYGYTDIDPVAVVNGEIVEPELIAQSVHDLFRHNLIGQINTDRVAMAIPAARTFTRTIQLPHLESKDLDAAIKLEAEQYIPVPLDDLYLDYNQISKTTDGIELLAVAVPKKIVDSYQVIAKLLGLDLAALETTIAASSRLFVQAEKSFDPTILIDFGSISTDLTIHDKTLLVSGTVPGGSDSFTELIARKLKVKLSEAKLIKTKYGLGVSKKQAEITEAVTPMLEQLLKEVKRMIRYYEDRSTTNTKISQIVTMGGGASTPGLTDFLTANLRLPVRMCDAWKNISFGSLQPPSASEKTIYTTVTGLALINPGELFV